MELLDIDVIVDLLQYGSLTLLLGVLVITPIELILYGVMKAVAFFRL